MVVDTEITRIHACARLTKSGGKGGGGGGGDAEAVASRSLRICGGVRPEESAATPEVQSMCDALKHLILDAARRRGWNGMFSKFEAIAFKTQVVRPQLRRQGHAHGLNGLEPMPWEHRCHHLLRHRRVRKYPHSPSLPFLPPSPSSLPPSLPPPFLPPSLPPSLPP